MSLNKKVILFTLLFLISIPLIIYSYGKIKPPSSKDRRNLYYVMKHFEATIIPINYQVQARHTDWYYDIDSRMIYSAGHDWVLMERLYIKPVDRDTLILRNEKIIQR